MSRVFVDTSGVLALLIPGDKAHKRALRAFRQLAEERAGLATTSYTLVEIYALLGRRFGMDEVSRFRDAYEPLLDVVWIDQRLHTSGLETMLNSGRRRLSLVDATSFVVMEQEQIDRAFAIDKHFAAAGFQLVI